jgi:hypothetical protein
MYLNPFSFVKLSGPGVVYLDMLEQYLMPVLKKRVPKIRRFSKMGALPHFHHEVRGFLDRQIPGKWIGRGGPITWPSRSPDLTPLHTFLLGNVKDTLYACPLPTTMLLNLPNGRELR